MYDELIHDLFPHRDGRGRPSYRQHQFETIREILVVLDDPSIVDVVVEAPTGSGKTSIAVTVARVLTREFAGAKAMATGSPEEVLEQLADHQVHMVTSMKMLQDAYLKDDESIVLVKGKNNYRCEGRGKQMALEGLENLSCEDREQIFGSNCGPGCCYIKNREKAKLSPIVLHNFDSFLYQASMGKVFGMRRLLTVDEAHNCEEKVRSFMTISFGPSLFERLGLKWVDIGDKTDIAAVTDWADARLKEVSGVVKDLEEELMELRKGAGGRARGLERARKTASYLKRLSMLHERLDRFCSSRKFNNPADWVVYDSHAVEGDVIMEPVDAYRYVRGRFLEFGRQRLHLSATILDGLGAYKKSINLPISKHIIVPSTFPAANRPLVLKSAGDLSYKGMPKNKGRMATCIKDVLGENRGKRGVIHCTSYKISDMISGLVKNSRLKSYDRRSRDDVIGRFMSGVDADAVLLAVGLSEGYDFKDDLCRFQVIIRVPYLPKDGSVERRSQKHRPFYGWRTALTLVQAYGRGVRSDSDHCQTYVLDERVKKFVRDNEKQLPDWFLEAISWARS